VIATPPSKPPGVLPGLASSSPNDNYKLCAQREGPKALSFIFMMSLSLAPQALLLGVAPLSKENAINQFEQLAAAATGVG
jgi:hypothetical protein